MLMQSTFSSSIENPITFDENSQDLETLLIVISGHPCDASKRCCSWSTAKRLYGLMQKYQLDRLQSWFSFVAGRYAGEAPIEALCMASSNPCFDEHLIQCAIVNGIQPMTAEQLYDVRYFVDDKASEPTEHRKACLLSPQNMTVKLGVDLGFKGTMGYCKVFSDLKCAPGEHVVWPVVAGNYVDVVRRFEAFKGTSVSLAFYIIRPTQRG
jgi:hypothetical protein